MSSPTQRKDWQIAPAAPPDVLARYAGVSPLLAQVLYNRGLRSPAEAAHFLAAASAEGGRFLGYPSKARVSIDAVVQRIVRAVKKREKIVIYGDFDADGVTSSVLMVQLLRALDANVHPYIPHRVDEGYGLNNEALLKLKRDGAQLVITVDCGIRSVDEVAFSKRHGLDIIVTDHHSIGAEVPPALGVINPKLAPWYSEPMLAGVGVAFRLAEMIAAIVPHSGLRWVRPLELDDLLDLVAIGTVADLAPMNRYENRALVKRGLQIINEGRRPGLCALMQIAGVQAGTATAQTIGFALGPRINAAGRLESAMLAYALLAAESERDALPLAQQLQALNVQRQELTRTAQAAVRAQLEADDALDTPLIFAAGDFRPGIVGLVAGRLTEEFYRPAVVMEHGEGESRASCRSIPQFNITDALDRCANLLVRHGGHAQAAGFTVRNEHIAALRERLTGIADEAFQGQTLVPRIAIDAVLEPMLLTPALCAEISGLEPTGHENALPILATFRLRVAEARTMGKDASHLKLKLTRDGLTHYDAVGWSMAAALPARGAWVDVAYQPEMNQWTDRDGFTRTDLQLRLVDIRPTDPDEVAAAHAVAAVGR
jgi:single-stranded-DNA-specific exonuclease